MKNLKDMISQQIEITKKTISSHGIDSDYTMYQIFVLQAVKVGAKEPYKIAEKELERLKDIRIKEWFEPV